MDIDNSGSNGIQTSLTYRGEASFSEPETETVRQYCVNHNFRLALNYHAYGNLLLTPWGYIPNVTLNSDFFSSIATDMTQYNKYSWGYSAELLYSVNGEANEWFYGEQIEKSKIYAMTPEVGSNNDNFWPSEDRIIPIAEENIYPNLYLAWVAGGFVSSQELLFDKEYYSANDSGSITLLVKNHGLEKLSDVSIKILPVDNIEILKGNSITTENYNAKTVDTLFNAIKFKITENALAGDSAHFEIDYYYNNLLVSTNKYSVIIGFGKTYFIDKLSTLDNWSYYSNVSKNWELTNSEFYSAISSITDSRVEDYLSNSEVSLSNKNRIDLTNIKKPILKFKTKYDIESGWDYAQVSISTDSTYWESIGGKKSKLGSGSFQPNDELIYDGTQSEWITEEININNYGGKKIYLKFELNSDENVEKDGWYIDDIEIFEYLNSLASVNDEVELPIIFSLSQNYPNPFNPATTIKYSIPVSVETLRATSVQLKIYDILGREVTTLVNKEQSVGNYEVTFDATNLTSGIYFYRLQFANFSESKKMLLLK